ncbi:DUF6879 family protein [Streptomyces corynorhini]|uniref:DUF6879 family protein n=1 Tax=Streptomyces corynorhini TaxID=2282652 RepID=UPI002D768C8A|nr:DUF6879 family protein [Streptomyces corynorhini]
MHGRSCVPRRTVRSNRAQQVPSRQGLAWRARRNSDLPVTVATIAIRILDVTDRPNPLDGAPDFWLLDRSTVVLMHYAEDGTQTGRELHEGDPAPFLEYQRVAVAESVPFREYVQRWPSSLTS